MKIHVIVKRPQARTSAKLLVWSGWFEPSYTNRKFDYSKRHRVALSWRKSELNPKFASKWVGAMEFGTWGLRSEWITQPSEILKRVAVDTFIIEGKIGNEKKRKEKKRKERKLERKRKDKRENWWMKESYSGGKRGGKKTRFFIMEGATVWRERGMSLTF